MRTNVGGSISPRGLDALLRATEHYYNDESEVQRFVRPANVGRVSDA
jgi:selenocysteine lyase/cysteine desulfurase